MEWFRHEIHAHIRDDGEEYVRFLMDVLEQRIRHSLDVTSLPMPVVVEPMYSPPPKRKRGVMILTPGVHRIVDGELLQHATLTTCRPHPPPPVQSMWSLPTPLSWSWDAKPRVRQRR